jgi:hypothetical protein
MFLALWEFEVKPGCEHSFQSVYGAQGDWARLFRTDPNFLETRLESRSAYEEFKELNHTAYMLIDKNCETLTNFERCLGMFDS